MAWETRNGKGRYYTHSRKVNGRVVREYVGNGPCAELAAQLDEGRRIERQQRAEADRNERERVQAVETELDAFCALASALATLALEAAGYHRHNRGEWRRKRGK